MKDKLQNENLEQMGRSLFKTTRPRTEAVEKIVSQPHLLASVKERIKADQQAVGQQHLTSPQRSNSWLWNWRTAAGALSLLTLGSALLVFQKEDSRQTAERIIPNEFQTSTAEAVEPPKIEEKGLINSAVKRKTDTGKVTHKPNITNKPDRIPKTKVPKTVKSPQKPGSEIFYSLTTGGNLEYSGEDLRVVRTELSKSDLLALGINLPLENEEVRLKTILLIGEDGVARAFRFVGTF